MTKGNTSTGGCLCSAIRYEYSGDPVLNMNCHCRDCQQASGSAFGPFQVLWKDSFRFLKGAPKYYAKLSDPGNEMQRGFCPDCGSPLTILASHRPKLILIHAASLDDPSTYVPAMDIFTDSAQPWDVMKPETEKYQRLPPIPEDLGR